MSKLSLLLLILLGCASQASPQPTAPPDAASEAPSDALRPGTHAYAMANLDRQIQQAEALALRFSHDWGRWAELAALWAQRARYSGDYGDYARAQDLYAVAFSLAPEGSGPLLGQARLHYSLHRLPQAEASLAVLERQRLDDRQRAEVLALRADIALQRAQLDEARALYEASLALRPSLPARYGLVQLAWWRGAYDEALTLLDACEALVTEADPTARMWLHLQRGLVELSRGRYPEALSHYQAADRALAGHWLVREHIAEVTALLGRTDEAIALYEAIVRETRNPEFMSALASLLIEKGEAKRAEGYLAWAEALYARQLALFPEAAAGHALEHSLEHGRDPALAVQLAEQNAAARPNGEALVLLAAAYRQAGRLQDAQQALQRAAATGWERAERDEEEARLARAMGVASLKFPGAPDRAR